MQTTALFLTPLDQLFFRDGRPFGASTRGVSGLPNPTTLAGALRTVLLNGAGADFRKLAAVTRGGAGMEEAFRAAGAPDWIARIRIRGPWLATLIGQKPTVYFRRPRHLRPADNGKLTAAQPLEKPLPGWQGKDGLLPLWCHRAKTGKETGFGDLIASDGLAAMLAGDQVEKGRLANTSDFVAWQDKTGIQLNEQTLTAKDEMIYAVKMLELKKNVGFYCEVQSEQALPFGKPALFPFGGESRYVSATQVRALSWPAPPTQSRRMLYLVSPGLFRRTWLPDAVPAETSVKAAAVDGPFAVSGWDLARGGPKATRFGVQPGSVYFCEGGTTFPASLCGDTADALQGYGDYLQGVWNYV